MPKKSNAKRSDGRYELKIYLGMVDGKKKYKTVYGQTQKQVQQKADEIKILLNKGIDVKNVNTSFSYWSDCWLKSIKRTKTETQVNNHTVILRYVNRFIGNSDISKIRTYQIQEIIDTLAEKNENTGKPTAKKTLRNYITSINFVFEFAITNRIIDFNPCRYIEVPIEAPQHERRQLSRKEQEWIKTTPHRGQLPAMLAMLAGLRKGEITALTWNDIDFKNKIITISKSYDFKLHRIKSPKTKAGIRKIPIPQELFDFLQRQEKKNILVCTNTRGNVLSNSSWQKLWDSYIGEINKTYGDFTKYHEEMEFQKKKYIKEGKSLNKLPKALPIVIEPFSIHCLRHTYATILYDSGVDVLTAKKLLGHADVVTTLRIYTHLSEENEKLNIEKLDAFLSQNKPEQA